MSHWYQKNLRFLQTVLRATDIINYNAKGVVEYMKKANANVLTINAGGVMDFFEEPLEMTKKNPFMKDGQDILADVCREIHAANMHVIVRVDFRGVEKERYDRHPEWFAKDIHGNPKLVQYATELFHSPCYLSHYANAHAVEFINYLMSHYDIDGVWENALGFGNGVCYCEHCRERYYKDTGKELPALDESGVVAGVVNLNKASNDFYSHDFDEYRAWKAVIVDEHIKRLRDTVKAYGEEKAYCAEIFDIYNCSVSKRCSIGHDNAKRHFDFLISCVFMDAAHGGTMPAAKAYHTINDGGTTIRFCRALQAEKQPVICTGGNGTRFRYISAPLVENRQWLWEIVSCSGGVWNCYFNGQHPAATHDNRAAYSEQDSYTFLAQNSDVISQAVPVRDVALFYSHANLNRFGDIDEKKDAFKYHFEGAERVLNEHHIPYGFIVGGEFFKPEDLKNIKTLILPNAGILSAREQEVIREYVKNGGGLVASFESTLYNEDGTKRDDYAFADLFGVHYAGESKDTDNDHYFKIKNASSPILAGVSNTELIMNAGKTAICTAEKTEEQVAGYLPLILNQPPEYAWIPEMDSPYAGIVARTYGKGRVVYFANTTDAQCYINGHEDFTEIYANAINYTSGKAYTIETNAYRSVHANLLESTLEDGKTAYILSFVNLTGTQQRPVKEIIPVGPFTATIDLKGQKLASGKVLWGAAQISEEDGKAVIAVDKLEDFASVQVNLD